MRDLMGAIDERAQAVSAVDVLVETNGILIAALQAGDSDRAHEAVTVMLHQVVDLYGRESVAMKQFFPVMDTIQRRITTDNLVGALSQAESFLRQLHEVRVIVSQG